MKLIKSPLNFLTAAGSKIGNSYLAVFQGSIYDINLSRKNGILGGFYPLSETIVTSTPLILTGLAVALAFRSGLFNIGAQGQFIFGAIGASYVGFHFNFSPILHVILALLAGIVLAGIYGGLVGVLKAKLAHMKSLLQSCLTMLRVCLSYGFLKQKHFYVQNR